MRSRGFLFDMDGVLYRGGEPISSALEFLSEVQARKIPYLLLTNHSCLTPAQYSKNLRGMGIRVPAMRIHTSSLATAARLKNRKVGSVFAIGEAGLHRALAEAGIHLRREKVRHVVVRLDRALSYDEDLRLAVRLIEGGAEFIGTNPDPTYPLANGTRRNAARFSQPSSVLRGSRLASWASRRARCF